MKVSHVGNWVNCLSANCAKISDKIHWDHMLVKKGLREEETTAVSISNFLGLIVQKEQEAEAGKVMGVGRAVSWSSMNATSSRAKCLCQAPPGEPLHWPQGNRAGHTSPKHRSSQLRAL
jgi:hypothetical protein